MYVSFKESVTSFRNNEDFVMSNPAMDKFDSIMANPAMGFILKLISALMIVLLSVFLSKLYKARTFV